MLSLQAVAGLIAGYTRGAGRMLAELGSGNADARFAVASVALLLGNLTAPGLILALSKIAALLVQALVSLPPEQATGHPIEVAEPAPSTQLVPALAHSADAGDAGMYAHTAAHHARASTCPKCGMALSLAAYGAARRWGHCNSCKGA